MTKHFRYFFDEGYGQVPTSKTKEVREQLIKAMSPGRPSTFYQALSNGVRDIRMPLYEEITNILTSAGVSSRRIWRKEIEEA